MKIHWEKKWRMTCVSPLSLSLLLPSSCLLAFVMSMRNFSFSRLFLFCGWQQQRQQQLRRRRRRQGQQQHFKSPPVGEAFLLNTQIYQAGLTRIQRDTKRDIIKFHFAKSRRLLFAVYQKAKGSRSAEGTRGMGLEPCGKPSEIAGGWSEWMQNGKRLPGNNTHTQRSPARAKDKRWQTQQQRAGEEKGKRKEMAWEGQWYAACGVREREKQRNRKGENESKTANCSEKNTLCWSRNKKGKNVSFI